MEQLVARRAHNPKVVGSSPAPATKQKNASLKTGFFVLNSFIKEAVGSIRRGGQTDKLKLLKPPQQIVNAATNVKISNHIAIILSSTTSCQLQSLKKNNDYASFFLMVVITFFNTIFKSNLNFINLNYYLK